MPTLASHTLRFSALWRRVALAVASSLLAAGPAMADNALDRFERLDKLDKQELEEALERSVACTRRRDFSCAEQQIKKAASLVNTAGDRSALAQAGKALADEKWQVAEEKRIEGEIRRKQAEMERRIAQQERELEEQQAMAEQQMRSQQRRMDEQEEMEARARILGAMLGQQMANSLNNRAADLNRARQFESQQAQVRAGIAAQQQQFARERQRLEEQREEMGRRRAQAQRDMESQRVQLAQATQSNRQQAQEQVAQQQRAQEAALQRQRQELAEQREQQQQRAQAQREAQERQARETERARQEEAERLSAAQARDAERRKAQADKAAGEAAARANMPDALAFCFQNERGSWFCDGKIQETSIGDKDLDAQLAVVGCGSPRKIVNNMISLVSTRVPAWGTKSGWLYRCDKKIDPGESGHVTWNRDIRKFWRGISW